MGINGFGCINHFFVGSFRLSVTDVIANRAGENKGILQNNAQLATQRMQGYIADILSVNIDCSSLWIIEAAEQVDNRALAGSGRPYKSDRISFGDFEIDIKENLLSWCV